MIAEGRRLDPRVQRMWWTIGGALALVVVVCCGVVLAFDFVPAVVPVAVAAVAVALAVLIPRLRYRRWRFALQERDLMLSKGALWLVVTLIPFDRIQYVESRRGPIDNLFGLTGVLVYTAAGRAGHIPGLIAAEAEELREELSKVAGTLSV